ncbi:S-adenosyl-L-methionine-dependent methyltransferase [Trematosphaeria pertusa]|uniref:S-adenosyl-L-methionine-dependent methyltransferase n=1 Tax=Trematosphaeria pertusa TaxID=390896 RepID=A0A6A6IFH4_9PLEO|nr:S-adenosyl-L-methionine-dependent methyltransferase [Trematosphaeria pertusa]KAF2249191.1 S-adenosyl-L-methionine-dependent methyltransferase [Trematosphaeria pertusa]
MATPFTPKQALHVDGALLQELQGNVTDSIARDLLPDLPPLTSTSVIHDNGCGYGAVTRAIMESNPPSGIQIHATDINPLYLAQLQAKLAERPSWPVEVTTMDACKLTFPNGMFDLSLATFIFPALSDDVGAAAHMLRTLKPGGTGVVAVWKEMPWHAALEKTHVKLCGEDEPIAPRLASAWWYRKEKIEQVVRDAGWRDVRFVRKAAWLSLGVDLKRWATIAWTRPAQNGDEVSKAPMRGSYQRRYGRL